MPGAVAMENTLGYLATVAKVPWIHSLFRFMCIFLRIQATLQQQCRPAFAVSVRLLGK